LVITPPRRHQRANRNTPRTPLTRKHHHSQFFQMPWSRTQPVTASGVSHEKLEATIEVPVRNHGSERPERKNSSTLLPPRRA
jgi:hypothetical protein